MQRSVAQILQYISALAVDEFLALLVVLLAVLELFIVLVSSVDHVGPRLRKGHGERLLSELYVGQLLSLLATVAHLDDLFLAIEHNHVGPATMLLLLAHELQLEVHISTVRQLNVDLLGDCRGERFGVYHGLVSGAVLTQLHGHDELVAAEDHLDLDGLGIIGHMNWLVPALFSCRFLVELLLEPSGKLLVIVLLLCPLALILLKLGEGTSLAIKLTARIWRHCHVHLVEVQ